MLQDETLVPNPFTQLPTILGYYIIFPLLTAGNYVQYKVLLAHSDRESYIIFKVT
jgi:hypothetical protein